MKTDRMVVDLVAGARPNFMKLAPVFRALSAKSGLECRIIHTGQHYDTRMNTVFFDELAIPEPAIYLEVGSGTHGMQTARILERYEAHLLGSRPDVTVVFGDINSTVACALAAVKVGVPVVHVEAGLRSFDRSMPEEINRILTDSIAELLLVSEPSGLKNLRKEGAPSSKVRLVGNVMIDTVKNELEKIDASDVLHRMGVVPRGYGLITMHRPSNVDSAETLGELLSVFRELSSRLPLVFPVHPRTRKAAEEFGLGDHLEGDRNLICAGPLPYRQNLALMANARVVLTDSGGIQEETAFLGIPCLTMRWNTERPITVDRGTSRLVGNDPSKIRRAFADVVAGRWKRNKGIALWDGMAALRVADEIEAWLISRRGGHP